MTLARNNGYDGSQGSHRASIGGASEVSMSHAVSDGESNRNDCRCSKSNHLPDRLSAMCHPLLGGQTAAAQVTIYLFELATPSILHWRQVFLHLNSISLQHNTMRPFAALDFFCNNRIWYSRLRFRYGSISGLRRICLR